MCHLKFIEIVGSSCSGKSHFLKKQGMVYSRVPVYLAPIGFFIALLVSMRGTFLLCLWCLRSDRSFWHIFRVMGHVFAKFGCRFNKARVPSSVSLVIDEGVSHIPFILMLSFSETELFLRLFSKSLSGISVVFIKVDPIIMRARLTVRGHKRVRNEADLERFCFHHQQIQEFYPELLKKSGLQVKIISG